MIYLSDIKSTDTMYMVITYGKYTLLTNIYVLERLDAILKLTQNYPSPLRVWLGPKLIVFIKDPDHLQASSSLYVLKGSTHFKYFLF